MMKPIKAWAADAYDFVQSACNLSGIVFAFERLSNDLREAEELRADHPCVVLWVDKMEDLSRSRSIDLPDVDESLDTVMVELIAVMKRLCDECKATDERNTHPDIQAVIVKLAKLSGSREMTAYGDAYDAARKMAA